MGAVQATGVSIMGFMDNLLGNSGLLGEIGELVSKNPKIAEAAASLLSEKAGTIGGSGGLGALVQGFAAKGMGDVVSSWLGSGENRAVGADQIAEVLGGDTLSQFAQKAGLDAGQAGDVLARVLPGLVDSLSPEGKAPDANGLEQMLGGLLSRLR
jgi:uncharacterized protein YidB (DUF937 family)